MYEQVLGENRCIGSISLNNVWERQVSNWKNTKRGDALLYFGCKNKLHKCSIQVNRFWSTLFRMAWCCRWLGSVNRLTLSNNFSSKHKLHIGHAYLIVDIKMTNIQSNCPRTLPTEISWHQESKLICLIYIAISSLQDKWIQILSLFSGNYKWKEWRVKPLQCCIFCSTFMKLKGNVFFSFMEPISHLQHKLYKELLSSAVNSVVYLATSICSAFSTYFQCIMHTWKGNLNWKTVI